MKQTLEYGRLHGKPINPGDGYEIVPADEYEATDMEYTSNGVRWEPVTWIFEPERVGVFLRVGVLAYRRNKQ